MTRTFFVVGIVGLLLAMTLFVGGLVARTTSLTILSFLCALPVGWTSLVFAVGRTSAAYRFERVDEETTVLNGRTVQRRTARHQTLGN